MLQTIPHDDECRKTENESKKRQLCDDAGEAVVDSERLQELVGPCKVAVDGFTVHLGSIEAENRLHGAVETVFYERCLEYPMKDRRRVVDLHEEIREQHEWADEEASENERELHIH